MYHCGSRGLWKAGGMGGRVWWVWGAMGAWGPYMMGMVSEAVGVNSGERCRGTYGVGTQNPSEGVEGAGVHVCVVGFGSWWSQPR